VHKTIEITKKILSENTKVQYGIFGFIASSSYFPPIFFLNEFLMCGSDPCDQDNRMENWDPYLLSSEDYVAVKEWWMSIYPEAVEDTLGVSCWNDWVVELLER